MQFNSIQKYLAHPLNAKIPYIPHIGTLRRSGPCLNVDSSTIPSCPGESSKSMTFPNNGCLSDPCAQLTLTACTEQEWEMECIYIQLKEEGLNDNNFICFWLILLAIRNSLPQGGGNVWEDRLIKIYKLKSELNYSQTWRQLRELTFQSFPKVIWSHIPSLGNVLDYNFSFP